MLNIGFNRIECVPYFPIGMNLPASNVIWESRSKSVKDFKAILKCQLRKKQSARCCYCRRLLGNDSDVHMEHFLEKSVLPELTFEVKNLALSCSACNIAKAGIYNRLCGWLSKQESRRTGTKSTISRCIALAGTLNSNLDQNEFRWVHPYFHNFDDHLSINNGWIFTSKTLIGTRTRRCLKFNEISAIEARARRERIAAYDDPIASLAAQLIDADEEQRNKIVKKLVEQMKTRKSSQPTP